MRFNHKWNSEFNMWAVVDTLTDNKLVTVHRTKAGAISGQMICEDMWRQHEISGNPAPKPEAV